MNIRLFMAVLLRVYLCFYKNTDSYSNMKKILNLNLFIYLLHT